MKIFQKSITYKVLQNIKKNDLIAPGDTVIVALSGGPDSVCLFDILYKLKDELKISLLACHYNHRLREQASDGDEKFVRKLCEERGVEYIIGRAPKKNFLKSEEKAREYRYAFFEKILGERRGDKIAIAHNSDDLAETFLLRLFRGSGIRGLISIPSQRENFIRPLLPIQRFDIEKYLKESKLSYRVDKSNLDPSLSRNYLRLKIMPLVKHLNPNFVETLRNSIRTIETDYSYLGQATEKEYKKISSEKEGKIYLNRSDWLLLHPALQSSVLRTAVKRIKKLDDVTIKQIEGICEIIKKGEGKKHKVLPHSLRVELESGKIVLSDNK